MADPEFAAFEREIVRSKGVVRSFQRYTSGDRADLAASHRLSPGKRRAQGEFFYTVPSWVPDRCYPTRGAAIRAAWEIERERRSELRIRLSHPALGQAALPETQEVRRG